MTMLYILYNMICVTVIIFDIGQIDILILDSMDEEQQPVENATQNIQHDIIMHDQLQHHQPQSHPISDQCNPPAAYTQINGGNFVKSLRMGRNSKFMCVFEEQPFAIQLRSITNCEVEPYKISITNQDKLTQLKQYTFDISNQTSSILAEIKFQSVPYDCIQARDGIWLISTKGMPPRIYKQQGEDQIVDVCHVGSFCNKKKNSQLYLAPIQLCAHTNVPDYAIGGGRRFLCSYNLQKMVSQQHGIFDKTNISAVEMINQNTAIVGTFEGSMTVFDSRSPKQSAQNYQQTQNAEQILRPHVDAVMSIVACPTKEHIFASSARKDDYIYIWDIRKYGQKGIITSYMHELIETRNGNQRIGLCFSSDGRQLYSGSESSVVLRWSYDQAESGGTTNALQKWIVANNNSTTVNSVIYDKENNILIYSTGSRRFDPIPSQTDSSEDIEDGYHKQLHQNMIAYIKLSS